MIGMDAGTGRPLADDAHLAQSVARILTTPIGTRVMRRDFGSLLSEMIDQPANQSTAVKLYGATAMALMRWERRLRITSVALFGTETPGAYRLDLEGFRTDAPTRNAFTRLSIPLHFRG